MSGLKIVDKVEVARRLRDARERAGLKQGDIAQRVKKDQGMISQWESGRIPAGARDVTELGMALGLRPDELYLENASSHARKPADSEHLTQTETDSLASIVERLLQMRRMGIPLYVTMDFLSGFLRETLSTPAHDTDEFVSRPQTREAIIQAQKFVDSALSSLMGDSVLGESLDDVASRLTRIIATLQSADQQDSSVGLPASGPTISPKSAPQTPAEAVESARL